MTAAQQIPFYSPDGAPLGFRSPEAAQRLIAGGHVKPSYGRKGHLRAIWLSREDGSNPVQPNAHNGTRYSFVESVDGGRCWKLRRLDHRDDDGVLVSTRGAYLQVVQDCLAS